MTTPTIPRPGRPEDRANDRSNDGAKDGAKDGAADLAGKKGKDGKKGKGGKDGAPKSKKKKLMILGAVLLVAGAAYMFVLKPKPAAGGAPEPGLVVKLDPLTLNLEGGHYLKLSMALQFTAAASAGGGHGGADEPDGSQALDLAIAQLSNKKIAELNTATARDKAKATLLKSVAEAYHQDVMDIYFTEFVMQ
jgi:flagellar FliL protein